MTCRVLIVDDEPNIVEGIKTILQKEMPVCKVVGVAHDGVVGMDMGLSLNPDIILTDIIMPNLGGIKMIRGLLEKGCKSNFIILTGYSEFQYAKEAIDLGVKSYITKPIDKNELCRILWKINSNIQEKNIKEYTLRKYIENACINEGELMLFFSEMGLELKKNRYCCAIFESEPRIEKTNQELFKVLKSSAERNLSKFPENYTLYYSDNQVAIIVGIERKTEFQDVCQTLNKMQREVAADLGCLVVAGIGRSYEQKEIKFSLKEAQCALSYKFIRGRNTVIHYSDIADIEEDTEVIASSDVEILESCVENMDTIGCRMAVEEIFNKINEKLSLEKVKDISLNLILLGIRKMPYMQFQISEYFGRDILSLENISGFGTMEQLKNWIINTLVGMIELMSKKNVSEQDDVVESAKKYMKKNFNKNITLNDISERLYINPYYFSQLFKKKTGENYLDYLTRLRVDKAKKLLKVTDMRIYEICEMVGYSNINHFNKVFERLVGIKPREYRENLKKVE